MYFFDEIYEKNTDFVKIAKSTSYSFLLFSFSFHVSKKKKKKLFKINQSILSLFANSMCGIWVIISMNRSSNGAPLLLYLRTLISISPKLKMPVNILVHGYSYTTKVILHLILLKIKIQNHILQTTVNHAWNRSNGHWQGPWADRVGQIQQQHQQNKNKKNSIMHASCDFLHEAFVNKSMGLNLQFTELGPHLVECMN